MQTNQTVKQNNVVSRARKIAEILGILAEENRNREWLLKEIKKHNLKISTKTAWNSYEILNRCPNNFVTNLYIVLKRQIKSGFDEVKTLTKTYHWLFTDIVGGSNPTIPTKEQVRKIVVLNELMARTETFRNRDSRSTIILPVGDGVAIGFDDSPEKPLLLAIELHKALSRYNHSTSSETFSIRIGIDMGPVYFVKDLNEKNNVWGPGIILTRRVMDLCGPMNIFASARIADDVRKLSPEYGKILHPIGNHSIKHGEELYIYNIYGSGFGNKSAPRKSKVAELNLERDLRKQNNFSFNEIELNLEVLDPKTMLTRHVLIWKVVNNSKEPKHHIFYPLDGDVPKEFGDLNVKVKDDYENTLEILSVNVNKPFHKEFIVQLNKPLKPKQKKTIILQYDWEEPERIYFYNLTSGCKHFGYSLTANKNVQLSPTILKVDPETGSKSNAIPSPEITIVKDKTVVFWSKDELISDEVYQFAW